MLTLTLSPEDISGAPPVAQAWIAKTLGFRFQNPRTSEPLDPGDPVPFQTSDEAEKTPDLNRTPVSEELEASTSVGQVREEVTKEEVLERAKSLMVTEEGKTAVKEALKEMGIQRVSLCPDDRLAEFLSKIAVA